MSNKPTATATAYYGSFIRLNTRDSAIIAEAKALCRRQAEETKTQLQRTLERMGDKLFLDFGEIDVYENPRVTEWDPFPDPTEEHLVCWQFKLDGRAYALKRQEQRARSMIFTKKRHGFKSNIPFRKRGKVLMAKKTKQIGKKR